MEREDRHRLAADRDLVLEFLKSMSPGPGKLRDVSPRDLVRETGLSEAELSFLLNDLGGSYRARVAATEDGRVIWRFPQVLERRVSGGRLQSLAAWLVGAGTRLARILVGLGYSFWAFLAYILFGAGPAERAPELHGRRLGFYDLVFSFVFGESGGRWGPNDEARDFLAWVDSRRGLVAAEEYALQFGLGLEEAEERLARFAAEYGGEPEALGCGILAWRFRKSGAAKSVSSLPWRKMARLSGNPPRANAVAALLGVVNVVLGAGMVYAIGVWSALDPAIRQFDYPLAALVSLSGVASPAFVRLFLGFVPLAAGFLGLSIPAIRACLLAARNRRRQRRNAIVIAGHHVLSSRGVVHLEASACVGKARHRLFGWGTKSDRQAPRQALARIAAEHGAGIEATPDGDLVYEFRRLVELMAALDRAREGRGRDPVAEPGGEASIVFDSGEGVI
jgi:hypothetical protein